MTHTAEQPDSPPSYETAQVGFNGAAEQSTQSKHSSDNKVPQGEEQPHIPDSNVITSHDLSTENPLATSSHTQHYSAPCYTSGPYTLISSSNYAVPSDAGTGHPPKLYQYTNPMTGEHITSLLPPDHPYIICLQTGHIPVNRFSPLGIIAAILWFPLGIGLCLLDRRVKCARCKEYISHGVCS